MSASKMHLDGPSSQSNALMKVMRGYKGRKDLRKTAGRAMPRQKLQCSLGNVL